MSYAIKVDTVEQVDWVQEFIDNPYFRRPQQLPSGRVTPEVAHNWKVEDMIEASKGTKQWISIGDRIRKRKEIGRKRFKKWKEALKQDKAGDEISYLTVSCDFQETYEFQPARQLRRSPEYGLIYEEVCSRLPIQGPKTFKEVEEEEEASRLAEKYFAEKHLPFQLSPKGQKWLPWTPRPEDDDGIPIADQIQVRVQIRETGELLKWILRKDREWPDFKYLVNSRLGHDEWDAWLGNHQWTGESFNGRIIKPKPGQEIQVVPVGFLGGNGLRREVIKGHVTWLTSDGKEVPLPAQTQESRNFYRQEKRTRAWEIISAANIPAKDWSMDQATKEIFLRQKGKHVGAEIPNKFGCYLIIQMPEENEWAYFVAMMDNLLGEDKWIAVINPGYGATPWLSAERSPNKNQRIRLFFLDEQLLKEQFQKLDERRNPAPFVWDCPEDDQEQENTVDIEDTDEESSENSPLLLTRKEKKIRIPTKSWSHLPWFKLEEAL
jgi:hypothetical protein